QQTTGGLRIVAPGSCLPRRPFRRLFSSRSNVSYCSTVRPPARRGGARREEFDEEDGLRPGGPAGFHGGVDAGDRGRQWSIHVGSRIQARNELHPRSVSVFVPLFDQQL